MLEIKVNNGNIEDALKRFKRQCARNGVLQEVRKREHYEKPSKIGNFRYNKKYRKFNYSLCVLNKNVQKKYNKLERIVKCISLKIKLINIEFMKNIKTYSLKYCK